MKQSHLDKRAASHTTVLNRGKMLCACWNVTIYNLGEGIKRGANCQMIKLKPPKAEKPTVQFLHWQLPPFPHSKETQIILRFVF